MESNTLRAGLAICLAAGTVLAAPALSRGADTALPKTIRVYVGTYTNGSSKGIYLFDLDTRTGELEPQGVAAETVNPSFLAIHPNKRFVYAVGEINNFWGQKAGAVRAFAVDARSGKLRLLNQQPSGGQGPCHVSVDPQGKNVLVANYSSGSAAALPVREDGSLAEPSSTVQHEGSGTDPKRQAGPHAHSINMDPAGRFAFVADLGLDKVFIYRFDTARGKLQANNPPAAKLAPAAGPRHLSFHPTGRFAYVNNEMASTVTVFAYDADGGIFREMQTIGTLPAGFKEPNTTAEVQVHPSGQFLYCSNRGHNSIALFTIDRDSGKLTAAGHTATRGDSPRNFGIDATGTWLIAANQKSDNLAVFRIAPDSGRLQTVGNTIPIASPVCVKFMLPE